MNTDSLYDPSFDSAFEDLCCYIGMHWFNQDEEFVDHDNDVIERIANMIIDDPLLYDHVILHFERLEKNGYKID